MEPCCFAGQDVGLMLVPADSIKMAVSEVWNGCGYFLKLITVSTDSSFHEGLLIAI
jgi:hypothetical protein